jgi:hypothetical protein
MTQDPKERPSDSQFERFVEAAGETRRSHLLAIFEAAFAKIVQARVRNVGDQGNAPAGRFRRRFRKARKSPSPGEES